MTLKEQRKSQNMTQVQLSQKLGVSIRTIKRWESQGIPKAYQRLVVEQTLKEAK